MSYSENDACITYNNECAIELETRLARLGVEADDRAFIGTVHGFALSQFARVNNVLVIVVIHPTKEGGLKGAGSLSLYDAADSSHWVNKADYGIKIESDHQNQQLTVEVGKVRHRPTGRRGSTIFEYIPEMELISQ